MPESDAGAPLEVDQLRLSVAIAGEAVGAYVAPEVASAPLYWAVVLALCFARDDGGASVMIDVEGLRDGVVVGIGATTLTLQTGEIVAVVVPLT